METSATEALHPDLERYSTEIRATLADFEALLDGLSDAQFNWSPAPGRWSIAQNLTHLVNLSKQDLAPMSAAIADARARNLTSPGPYKYSWMPRYFIKQLEPPSKSKFKTTKSYQAPPHADPAATFAEYRRIITGIQERIQQANGLDLARVKTQMPALSFLKTHLGARFAMLAAHDRRHLWQARNIRDHKDFPRA